MAGAGAQIEHDLGLQLDEVEPFEQPIANFARDSGRGVVSLRGLIEGAANERGIEIELIGQHGPMNLTR